MTLDKQIKNIIDEFKNIDVKLIRKINFCYNPNGYFEKFFSFDNTNKELRITKSDHPWGGFYLEIFVGGKYKYPSDFQKMKYWSTKSKKELLSKMEEYLFNLEEAILLNV